MKTITVTLAGESYTIQELPRKRNAAWREQFQEEFAEAAGALGELGNSNIGDAGELSDIVRSLVVQVNGAINKAVALLFAYAPVLHDNADHIDQEAFDSEILDAFVAVLGLAYPFGSVLQTVANLSSGLPRA